MAQRKLCWVAREVSPVRDSTPQPFRDAIDSLLLYDKGGQDSLTSQLLTEDEILEKSKTDETGSLVYPNSSESVCSVSDKNHIGFETSISSNTLDSALATFASESETSDFYRSLNLAVTEGQEGSRNFDNDLDKKEYEVEAILDEKKGEDGVRWFLIKWLGYDDPDSYTWEPYDTVMELRALDTWEAWKVEKAIKFEDRNRSRKAKNDPHEAPAPKSIRRTSVTVRKASKTTQEVARATQNATRSSRKGVRASRRANTSK